MIKLTTLFKNFLQVWINLISLAIITIFVLKSITKNQLNYRKNFDLFIRLLTTQSSKLVTQMNLKLNNMLKFVTFLLILIWIISSVIVVKAFTGNLLKSYFNVKSVPIVNSLDDIYNNKELILYSELNSIRKLNNSYGFDSNKVQDLLNRSIIDNIQSNQPSQFLSRVINGKIVILRNSLIIEQITEVWKKWQKLFTVLQNKYLNSLANFFVKKHINYSSLAVFL